MKFLFQFADLCWARNDKIRLTEGSVITLHQGKLTNSRRIHPIPQLECVSGCSVCISLNGIIYCTWGRLTLSVVQCYNQGSNGFNFQWKCHADMGTLNGLQVYKFGTVEVNCEGYDYPDDPFILKDSCGLKYTVVVDSYVQESLRESLREGLRESLWERSCLFLLKLCLVLFVFVCLLQVFSRPRERDDPNPYSGPDPDLHRDGSWYIRLLHNEFFDFYDFISLLEPILVTRSGSTSGWTSGWTSGFGGTTRR